MHLALSPESVKVTQITGPSFGWLTVPLFVTRGRECNTTPDADFNSLCSLDTFVVYTTSRLNNQPPHSPHVYQRQQDNKNNPQITMEVEEMTRVQRALDMYEKGASSEATGLMREAISYYQSAIKIHNDVEKIYRERVYEEYKRQKEEYERQKEEQSLSSKLKVLRIGAKPIRDQPDNGINTVEEEEEEVIMDPCWLLDILTDDILIEICTILSHVDPHAHVSFSASCRRVSNLAMSSMAYRDICHQVYPHQVYSSSAVQMNHITTNQEQMVKNWDYQWPAMLNDRPFLKYKGVYIAKVTYISEGARSFSLMNNIKLVTYFRYIRFYPDGTAIKLTTTDEPSLIVPHFSRENINDFKMALMTQFTIEMDGQVTMVRHTADFDFVEELKIVSLGDRKFHRLQWVSSGTVDKEGERSYFNMSKEKPFNFSGVRSYT